MKTTLDLVDLGMIRRLLEEEIKDLETRLAVKESGPAKNMLGHYRELIEKVEDMYDEKTLEGGEADESGV